MYSSNLFMADDKIPSDISIFTKEKCQRAEAWAENNNQPLIVANQTWETIQNTYTKYKQKKLILRRRIDDQARLIYGLETEEIYKRLSSHFTGDGKISKDDCIAVDESIETLCEEYGVIKTFNLVLEQLESNPGVVEVYKIYKNTDIFKPKCIDINRLPIDNIYFTPKEIRELKGVYSKDIEDDFNYDGWLEAYDLTLQGQDDPRMFDLGFQRIKKLKKFSLYTEPSKEQKESILRLGWNPEISFTEQNVFKARERLNIWLEDKYGMVDMVDLNPFISNMKQGVILEDSNIFGDKKPIYIVFKKTLDDTINTIISKFTHSFWAHAAFSFDYNLKDCYTFDGRHGGFTKESIYEYPKGSIINVIACFVPQISYEHMQEKIKHYKNIKNETSYSFANLIACLTKKANENTKSMVCSNFVDYMLKIGDVSPTKLSYSIITPGRLRKAISQNKKKRFYEVYKGPIEDYNPNKILLYLSKTTTMDKITEDADFNKLDKEVQQLYKELVEPYINMEVISDYCDIDMSGKPLITTLDEIDELFKL